MDYKSWENCLQMPHNEIQKKRRTACLIYHWTNQLNELWYNCTINCKLLMLLGFCCWLLEKKLFWHKKMYFSIPDTHTHTFISELCIYLPFISNTTKSLNLWEEMLQKPRTKCKIRTCKIRVHVSKNTCYSRGARYVMDFDGWFSEA